MPVHEPENVHVATYTDRPQGLRYVLRIQTPNEQSDAAGQGPLLFLKLSPGYTVL